MANKMETSVGAPRGEEQNADGEKSCNNENATKKAFNTARVEKVRNL